MKLDFSRAIATSSLDLYLRDIKGFHKLSDEEINELGRASLKGDLDARNRLVVHNLRLVLRVASWFTWSKVPLEDLVQAGNGGLIRAAERFDPRKGFKFATYAKHWIKARIRRVIKTSFSINIPEYLLAIMRRIKIETEEFERQKDRKPTSKELSQILGVRISWISKALLIINGPILKVQSGNNPIEVNGEDARWEMIRDSSILLPDEVITAKEELELAVKGVLNVLENISVFRERDRDIFKLVYGLDGWLEEKPFRTVGEIYALSHERIRQIVNKTWDDLGISGASGDKWLRGEIRRIQELECLIECYEYEEESDIREFFQETDAKSGCPALSVRLDIRDLGYIDYLLRIARAAGVSKTSRSFVVRCLIRDSMEKFKGKTPAEIVRYFRDTLREETLKNTLPSASA